MHSAIANLTAGTVQGALCANSPAFSFQGIPFAEPPIDHLRFMPPKLFNSSFDGGSLDATKESHPCIQWTESAFSVDDPSPSENCLHLNVFVPKDKPEKLPVKVFTYGGGNVNGGASYPLYNGCNLASDSIVVTFNYRLGPLGFLAVPDTDIQGNMAIQDFQAALKWVQANIGQFDGDPKKVMLFAQSAGAANAFALSATDGIADLVSGIVLESGGGQDLTPKDTAQRAGKSYADELKCSDTKCLQSKTVDELIHAFHHTPVLLQNGHSLGFEFGISLPNRTNLNAAILDGDFIKDQPLKVGSQVPIIAGSNARDSSFFVVPNYSDTSITNSTWQNFLQEWGPYANKVDDQYPLCMFDGVLDAIVHVTTMSGFTCPIYKALRAAKKSSYAYRFDHTPSCPWMWVHGKEFPKKNAMEFGATHTAELPFTLGNINFQPETNGTCNGTDVEQKMSKFMVDAWTHLATDGNPGGQWKRFDNSDPSGLVIQNGTSFGSLDFSECEFWDGLWAQMGGVNFSTPNGNHQRLTLDKSCRPNAAGVNGIHWGLLIASVLLVCL